MGKLNPSHKNIAGLGRPSEIGVSAWCEAPAKHEAIQNSSFSRFPRFSRHDESQDTGSWEGLLFCWPINQPCFQGPQSLFVMAPISDVLDPSLWTLRSRTVSRLLHETRPPEQYALSYLRSSYCGGLAKCSRETGGGGESPTRLKFAPPICAGRQQGRHAAT